MFYSAHLDWKSAIDYFVIKILDSTHVNGQRALFDPKCLSTMPLAMSTSMITSKLIYSFTLPLRL